MHTIARPSGDQPFRIGNSRLCVLHDVALDVTPLTVAIAHITLRSKVDGEDTVAPEDIGAECDQSRVPTVVLGLGDEVRLEELNAGRRQFNDFSQIDRNETFHLQLAHRSVLQNVDGRIVAVVSNHIAQSERVYVFVFRLN